MIIFGKVICTTHDMKLYNDIQTALSKNGIKYTTRINSPTNPARYRGVPLMDNSVTHEYRILVSRKDFDHAKKCIGEM